MPFYDGKSIFELSNGASLPLATTATVITSEPNMNFLNNGARAFDHASFRINQSLDLGTDDTQAGAGVLFEPMELDAEDRVLYHVQMDVWSEKAHLGVHAVCGIVAPDFTYSAVGVKPRTINPVPTKASRGPQLIEGEPYTFDYTGTSYDYYRIGENGGINYYTDCIVSLDARKTSHPKGFVCFGLTVYALCGSSDPNPTAGRVRGTFFVHRLDRPYRFKDGRI